MHPERYFFAVQLPTVQARNTAFGLTKLAAAACMQCTAQKQQKAANTGLLESRSLLQTATLVFPQPIVCSRLSNNINILAKKIVRPPTGGGVHGPPAPGWIRHCILKPNAQIECRWNETNCNWDNGKYVCSAWWIVKDWDSIICLAVLWATVASCLLLHFSVSLPLQLPTLPRISSSTRPDSSKTGAI